jgi:RimJ/RimL family protein N-acetyltransferase
VTTPAAAHGEIGSVRLELPTRVDLSGFTMRAWSPADAAALRAALEESDAHLRAWTPWVVDGRVPGLTLEERLARHAADFAAGREWVYGLFDPSGRVVLGGCGLHPRIGPRAVELGYWLSVAHTGRGLATQAAGALTQLAFASPEVDRVEIRCDPRNHASARVPARLGYELTADTTEATGAGGETVQLMIWRMTRAQFESRPAQEHRQEHGAAHER